MGIVQGRATVWGAIVQEVVVRGAIVQGEIVLEVIFTASIKLITVLLYNRLLNIFSKKRYFGFFLAIFFAQ